MLQTVTSVVSKFSSNSTKKLLTFLNGEFRFQALELMSWIKVVTQTRQSTSIFYVSLHGLTAGHENKWEMSRESQLLTSHILLQRQLVNAFKSLLYFQIVGLITILHCKQLPESHELFFHSLSILCFKWKVTAMTKNSKIAKRSWWIDITVNND